MAGVRPAYREPSARVLRRHEKQRASQVGDGRRPQSRALHAGVGGLGRSLRRSVPVAESRSAFIGIGEGDFWDITGNRRHITLHVRSRRTPGRCEACGYGVRSLAQDGSIFPCIQRVGVRRCACGMWRAREHGADCNGQCFAYTDSHGNGHRHGFPDARTVVGYTDDVVVHGCRVGAKPRRWRSELCRRLHD
jgi:hypothetical protein